MTASSSTAYPTTRSVSPTEAGERLLQTVGPRFEEIEAELAALSELREKPLVTHHAGHTNTNGARFPPAPYYSDSA